MSNFDDNFQIKHQIKQFDDLKLPNRIKSLVNSKKDSIYRFLFYGTSGLGKTTLSKILSKNHDILYLSGSNDFNIAKLREKVYPFCSSYSVDNKPKVCIIDECDNIKKNIQEAFKIVLDSSIKSVKFIFITNNYSKIDDAIKSRCTEINFNYIGNELTEQQTYYVKYAVEIAQKEKIDFDKEGMMELYRQNFPDFRKLLDVLQQFKDSKTKVTLSNVNVTKAVAGIELTEIYNLIEKPQDFDSKSTYETLSKFKDKEDDVLKSLCEPFFNYLNTKEKYDTTLKVAEIVNKYCVDYDKTMNKFALLISCIYELRKLNY